MRSGLYYRRKILLAFLQTLGGSSDKLRLQKLLFLFKQEQSKNYFDFVPYMYGCFSFQANSDLSTMSKTGWLKDDEKKWHLSDNVVSYGSIEQGDAEAIQKIIETYGNWSVDELIRYTYTHYPYFASNSQIAKKVLSSKEFDKVQESRPVKRGRALFTIGYEGRSLEKYLNLLIEQGIRLLCDVRRNPISMKYGFSKGPLKNACEKVGIGYQHIPALGIAREYRQNLEEKEDYLDLFEKYRNEMLPANVTSQQDLLGLVKEHKRIAITCFEADHNYCHRSSLADSVKNLRSFDFETCHI